MGELWMWCLLLTLLLLGVGSEPHHGLEEGDSPCLHAPCHHGVCVEDDQLDRGYRCYCENGYTGRNCELDWDECWNSPCLNGGTCHNGIAHFNCTCAAGFTGQRCDVNIDDCLSDPCLNNGTCVDQVDGYTCDCLSGFRGQDCEIDIQVCNTTMETNQARCANGGECEDGWGDTFTCHCTKGWTGETCEDNVDECEDDPCLNGGHCIDLMGDFQCSCTMYYAGRYCEERLEQCEDNPCLNGALCLLEDDLFRCYCVPDYHGKRCQFKYNECQLPPGPKCLHGGECQDDVGDFQCDCPPGYSGNYCQCIEAEDTCLDLNETLQWTLPPGLELDYSEDTTQDIGFAGSSNLTTVGVTDTTDNDSSASTTEDSLDRDASTISTSLISEQTTETLSDVSPTPVIAQSEEPRTGDGELTATGSTHILWEDDTTMTSSTEDTDLTMSTMEGDLGEVDPSMLPGPDPTGDTDITKNVTDLLLSQSDGGVEARTDPGVTLSEDETAETEAGVAGRSDLTTEETTMVTWVDVRDTTTEVMTEDGGQKPHAVAPTDITKNVTELIDGDDDGDGSGLDEVEATESSGMWRSTTESLFDGTVTLSTEPLITLTTLSPRDATIDASDSTMVDRTAVTVDQFGDTTVSPVHQTGASCAHNVCRNGGTCLSSIDGFQCHCKLQYAGRHCERRVNIQTPGFVGHSYLVHNLAKANRTMFDGFNAEIKFKTSHSEGLLFYTGTEHKMFISSYIQEGILHFKVSCGHQLITFSDPKHKVDTGDVHTLELTIDLNEDDENPTCTTEIKLNGTHTMRGEQEILQVPELPEYIYVGGTPRDISQINDGELAVPRHGLRGCVRHFVINDEEINLFGDAVSGQDIIECDTTVCAISPCSNNGVCNQDPTGSSWFCECLPGFTGPLCERTVCNANPCLHGGTCIGKTKGDGFICLCPFGRRGAICDEEVEVNQPSFTSWVVGYSSFLTYQTPQSVSSGFEFKLHFTTSITNQVALLLFMGQKGPHREGSDYLSVSFIKGHVLLTWDLGAGPRRIFTDQPVDTRIHVHTVHAGRWGRLGWLQVDHYPNITGLAPGRLSSLNVNGQFYIGGHENFNFTGLPHDLPVHTGFTGCIFDIVMTGSDGEPMVSLPVRGRNVQQCQERICDRKPCGSGFCLDYGASFSCRCQDGSTGASCDEKSKTCNGQRNPCMAGATCVAGRDGYRCICPLGRSGIFCEKNITISDAKFRGDHSYIAVQLRNNIRYNTVISFEMKAAKRDGLLLHASQRTNDFGDFISLLLFNGTIVLSYGIGSEEKVVTVQSNCCINLTEWTSIKIERREGMASLTVNNSTYRKEVAPMHSILDITPTLYLGGLPDMSAISEVSGTMTSRFSGCLRHLTVNKMKYKLTADNDDLSGVDIDDCDGTACGAELCDNHGACRTDNQSRWGYTCDCGEGHMGRNCQIDVVCESVPCQNGGDCLSEYGDYKCSCSLGHGGDSCEEINIIQNPQFGANGMESYLHFHLPDNSSVRYTTEVEFDVKTSSSEALLVWFGVTQGAEDYLGVGIDDGLVKVVWNLGWFSRSELMVPDRNVSDGKWHHIRVYRDRQKLILTLDELTHESSVTGTYSELNTGSDVLFGSSHHEEPVEDFTRGQFRSSLVGCLRDIKVQGLKIDLARQEAFLQMTGRNIQNCS